MSYHIISYYIIPYHIISYYIIQYHVIVYYTILYYIILYYEYIDIYTVHHSMLINISQVISLHVYIQANLLCVLFSGNNVMGRSIVLYSTFSVLSIRISEPT